MSRVAVLVVLGCVLPACGAADGPAGRDGRSARVAPTGTSPTATAPAVASPTADVTPSTPPGTPRRVAPRNRSYAVLDVVDGDTVRVAYRGGESVRVIGIDTPETVHPSVGEECGGAAASRAARRLLGGTRVRLAFDPSQGRRDAYGRLLAYLQVSGVGDFGLAMVARGHAVEYTYDTAYRHQARYRHAEARARAEGRGLWGTCGGADVPVRDEPPPEPGPAPGPGCEDGYDPCVPSYPPDVDCADVEGPVRVTGRDPHRLDADGDGSACES